VLPSRATVRAAPAMALVAAAAVVGCGASTPDGRAPVATRHCAPARVAVEAADTSAPFQAVPPPREEPPSPAGSGDGIWARRLGGDGMDVGAAVAVDSSDNIFVAGNFTESMDLGDGAPLTSEGLEDVFLVKMNQRGHVLWARVFGGPGHTYADDLAVDADGNAYLTGAFTGQLRIGERVARCEGVHDVFVVQVTAGGDVGWSRVLGDRHDQINLRVEAARAGGVYLAGWFRGTVRPARRRHSSYPDKATFVAKLGDDGRGLWSDSFGHVYDYADPGLAVDDRGGLVLSGGTDPVKDLPGERLAPPDRVGDLGLVVARYDEGGRLSWRRRYGGGSDNMITRAAVAPGGRIVVAGSFGGILDFGGAQLAADGLSDVFVVELEEDGDHVWSRTVTGSRYQSMCALAVSSDSTIFVAGQFEGGPLDFGGEVLDGDGYIDMYLAAYSGEGELLWSRAYGDDQIQWPADMVLDSAGNVIVVGAFAGSIGFGGEELSSAGGHDVFVAKLRP